MTVLDEFLNAQRDYRKAVQLAYREIYAKYGISPTYERKLVLQEFVLKEKERMIEAKEEVEIKKEEILEEYEEMKMEVEEYIPPTEISMTEQFSLDYASPTWRELEAKRPHDYFEMKFPDWKSLDDKNLGQTIFDYFDVETVNERLPVADFVMRKLIGKTLKDV